jgi:electron transport complex protein RnfE
VVRASQVLELARAGLWTRNQALVALLGLCPLLAVSNTVVNSLGLGLATTLTLILSNGLVSLLRHRIVRDVRLPVFVLVIAATVTAIDLLMAAWCSGLHRILGIFIPLIVTNCAILGRAEAFASRQPPPLALLDGLFTGLGFTAALTVLGGAREALGMGTLLSHADLLFGPAAKTWTVRLATDYDGFLLALLPPGAFIGLGLLIVLKNLLDARFARRPSPPLRPAGFARSKAPR